MSSPTQAVASGTRLVIEYASLWAQVHTGTVVASAYVGIFEGAGGTVPDAYLPLTKTATDGLSDYYTASAPFVATPLPLPPIP